MRFKEFTDFGKIGYLQVSPKNKYSVNVWVISRKLLNLQMIDNEWQKVVESGFDRMGGGI